MIDAIRHRKLLIGLEKPKRSIFLHYVRQHWRILASVTAVTASFVLGLWLLQPQEALPAPGGAAVQESETVGAVASATSDEAVSQSSLDGITDVNEPTQSYQTNASSYTTAVQQSNPSTTTSEPSKPTQTSTTQPNQPTTTPQLNVKLSINDSAAANVTVPQGANQCDVLTAALAQGVLSSLQMYYNSTYKTYGVYIINGQGSHDVVWWAYTVNDRSPPVGCSNVQVSGGDNINWEYTGR